MLDYAHYLIMFNLVLVVGWANVVAGRAEDVFGRSVPIARAVWRCMLPALLAGILAITYTNSAFRALYASLAIGLGSALWFPWGWSFDEINGTYDAGKYPRWVQKIGVYFFPIEISRWVSASTNRERGILMKGIRGAFDIATFALLAPFNPWIMLLWLPTFGMGLVYWICGKITSAKAVPLAEFVYGCLRGALIGAAIIMAYGRA